MKFERTARITFMTENADGNIYTPDLTVGELIDDWYGDCNIVPANDAPVYKVRIDGKKLAPWQSNKIENFLNLMEMLTEKKFLHPEKIDEAHISGNGGALRIVVLQDYTIPLYGNKRCLPYGNLKITDGKVTKLCPIKDDDRHHGRQYICFMRKRHYVRNEGTLYNPKFVFCNAPE